MKETFFFSWPNYPEYVQLNENNVLIYGKNNIFNVILWVIYRLNIQEKVVVRISGEYANYSDFKLCAVGEDIFLFGNENEERSSLRCFRINLSNELWEPIRGKECLIQSSRVSSIVVIESRFIFVYGSISNIHGDFDVIIACLDI